MSHFFAGVFRFRFLILMNVFVQSTNAKGECPVIYMMDKMNNQTLTGHVLKRFLANSESHCDVQCIIADACVSYNLGPRVPSGRFQCELNKADHIKYPSDLIFKPGYIYRATENPCSHSDCPRNSTCVPNFADNNFTCVCPRGFGGNSCEVVIGKNILVRSCSGSKLTMQCPARTTIRVLRALYGRKLPGSEACPHKQTSDTNCAAANSFSVVQARCAAPLTTCTLEVEKSLFGVDPCVGTYKYLEVEYVCVPV